ncbi:hypothetical protein DFS34DRAFT_698633 [Phlyctochytrium arcticum]|nr:hypothetical protein DFS34DRAFT_698633 [Phlyctochytrium arcticum]
MGPRLSRLSNGQCEEGSKCCLEKAYGQASELANDFETPSSEGILRSHKGRVSFLEHCPSTQTGEPRHFAANHEGDDLSYLLVWDSSRKVFQVDRVDQQFALRLRTDKAAVGQAYRDIGSNGDVNDTANITHALPDLDSELEAAFHHLEVEEQEAEITLCSPVSPQRHKFRHNEMRNAAEEGADGIDDPSTPERQYYELNNIDAHSEPALSPSYDIMGDVEDILDEALEVVYEELSDVDVRVESQSREPNGHADQCHDLSPAWSTADAASPRSGPISLSALEDGTHSSGSESSS